MPLDAANVTGTLSRRAMLRIAGLGAASGLAGCGGATFSDAPPPSASVAAPQDTIGAGTVRVGLILPLSATGNAGLAAQAMRNAAELAIAEFNAPNISLIVKDDGGTAEGGQRAAEAAIADGCEIVLGPLFAVAVRPAGQVVRQRGVPLIAFSTDSSVASRGVYLLSFLPSSDVDRIVAYSVERGRRAFAAALPENAYGQVVEAAFQQAVAQRGGRVVGITRYPLDRVQMNAPLAQFAATAKQADALLLPDATDSAPHVVQSLRTGGVDFGRVQLLGTGLWDDASIHRVAAFNNAWYAAPDAAGFRNFSNRFHSKFGRDPVRTASLAYDAVSLVAALTKTQGSARFSETVLTNQSGFSGVDGVFRFTADGTCERALAVHQITGGSSRVIAAAPRSFAGA